MENTVKFLSSDRSCRFSVINHVKLKENKELKEMNSDLLRDFASQLLVNTILLSAINSHLDKISFSFRFSADLSIFCEINRNSFFFSFSDKLKKENGGPDALIKPKSILSVTKGDWHTGLHTGSVLVSSRDPHSILAYYASQSEQLNVSFVSCQQMPDVSIIIQPLPFTTDKQLINLTNQLYAVLQNQSVRNWDELILNFESLGKIIDKNELIF